LADEFEIRVGRNRVQRSGELTVSAYVRISKHTNVYSAIRFQDTRIATTKAPKRNLRTIYEDSAGSRRDRHPAAQRFNELRWSQSNTRI
jgi:hypothetical protein